MNRLALGAPPSGALFVLALTHNVLKKNSECRTLIQVDKVLSSLQFLFHFIFVIYSPFSIFDSLPSPYSVGLCKSLFFTFI